MRWLIAVLLVVAAGYPLALAPSTVVAVIAAGAVTLCALGVVARSTPVVTAGVALGIGELTLAIALSDAPARLGDAVVGGVALALLLETAEFEGRLRGAALGPRVVASQLWSWAGYAASSVAITLVLLAAAGGIGALVRVPWAPVLAAAGGLLVLGAAAGALRHALTSVDRS